MTTKVKVKRLNESQRSDIIAKLGKPNAPSKRSVAREYGVSESAIRKLWENRGAIQARCAFMSEETKLQTFRASVGRFSEIENKLSTWIEKMHRTNIRVPPSLVILKAKQLAAEASISEDEFKASWQWLSRFKARCGLQKVVAHGDGAEAKKDESVISDVVGQYDPENVYNMGAAGLFFRLLPRYSQLLPHEDLSSPEGLKKAKERVSLIVCTNATGTHKLTCTVVGRDEEPECIQNREWPLRYFHQNKAWMNADICARWFDEVFVPEVKKRTDDQVLLLMEDIPGLFESFERDNIKVAFFPRKQPCDLGIIEALKKRYKYLYLKDVVEFYQLDEKSRQERLHSGAAGVGSGGPAHLLDAANYLKRAWDKISVTSIKKAFQKSELLKMEDCTNEEIDWITPEILRNFDSSSLALSKEELEEFMHADDVGSEEFVQAILEDVNEVVTAQGDSETERRDKGKFVGFEELDKMVGNVEDQLLCADARIEAGEEFDELRKSFDCFRRKLRQVKMREKDR